MSSDGVGSGGSSVGVGSGCSGCSGPHSMQSYSAKDTDNVILQIHCRLIDFHEAKKLWNDDCRGKGMRVADVNNL